MKKTIGKSLLGALLLCAESTYGQRHEAAFTAGALAGSKQAPSIGTGSAISGSYAYWVFETSNLGLAIEGSVIASPLQEIWSPDRNATRDFASLYVIPALRLEIHPRGRVSPFASAGGGYALFEQSLYRIDGAPNLAPRYRSTGALALGGGVDVRVWRSFAVRWEVRDLYSGNPALNTGTNGSGFNNLFVAGGLAVQFGGDER